MPHYLIPDVARLEQQLKQAETLNENHRSFYRGYRGTHQIGETTVLMPKPPKKIQSKYMGQKLSEKHLSRAGLEPVIGHLKQDHRFSRYF